jgi:hypothetical protein
MIAQDALNCPCLICEACGQRILDLNMAVLVYKLYRGGELGQSRFVHKGECDPHHGPRHTASFQWLDGEVDEVSDDQWGDARGPFSWWWEEGRTAFTQILANAGIASPGQL